MTRERFLLKYNERGVPFLIASTIALAITLPQLGMRIPDLSYGLYIYGWPVEEAVMWLDVVATATSAGTP